MKSTQNNLVQNRRKLHKTRWAHLLSPHIQRCVFTFKAGEIHKAPDSPACDFRWGGIDFHVPTMCLQALTFKILQMTLNQSTSYSHQSIHHILAVLFQPLAMPGSCVSTVLLGKAGVQAEITTSVCPRVTQPRSAVRGPGSLQKAITCILPSIRPTS